MRSLFITDLVLCCALRGAPRTHHSLPYQAAFVLDDAAHVQAWGPSISYQPLQSTLPSSLNWFVYVPVPLLSISASAIAGHLGERHLRVGNIFSALRRRHYRGRDNEGGRQSGNVAAGSRRQGSNLENVGVAAGELGVLRSGVTSNVVEQRVRRRNKLGSDNGWRAAPLGERRLARKHSLAAGRWM